MNKHTCLIPRLSFLILLACFLPNLNYGQTYFQKVYIDAPYDQEGQDVLPMADGGYLICGYTTNSTQNDADVEVLKADATGNLVWKKTYGGAKVDFANHMCPTPDGNYLLVGYSQSYGGGDFDVLLLKIDADGNTIWLKTYGGSGNDQGMDVSPTADGNFIVTGYSNTSSNGGLDMYLAKVDASGSLLWDKRIGGSAEEISNCVKQATDGGYIVMGMTMSYGTEGDAYLVKTDASGNVSWTQTFGGAHYDEGVYVSANSDGTYTFLVRDSSGANKDIDLRIIKTDASGNTIWNKVYGGPRKDTPKMIQPTMDGGYIVCGNTRSFGLVNPDMWILKFDAGGDTTWARRYGGASHEHCYTVRELSDGSYIASGKTESYSPNMEVIMLKLNSTGTMGIKTVDLASNESFNIFPNPASEEVQLDLAVEETASLTITDMSGREVYALAKVEPGSMRIPLQQHAAGVYFVTVRSGSQVSTRKLILNNHAHEK